MSSFFYGTESMIIDIFSKCIIIYVYIYACMSIQIYLYIYNLTFPLLYFYLLSSSLSSLSPPIIIIYLIIIFMIIITIIIIIIAGVSRFTVTKLVKTLPYIVADVELNLIDDAGIILVLGKQRK
jgi:hypothetical protein